jgi:phospholipid/cholesterol/gamma-HCH transport system substrate-binding protein
VNLTRAQKVRLGAFVFAGAALFVGTVVVLAGLRIGKRRDPYTVRFTEDVSGLEVSAPVKYQGLRVGSVEDMRISEGGLEIEVTIGLDPRTVLHEGSRAELASGGLTGLKSITLVPGDPAKPIIQPGSELEAGTSFVERITGRAEEIAVKVELVANQLAAWTREENRVRAEKLVDSTTELTGELDAFLAANREPLRVALLDVSKASRSVAKLGAEGDKTVESIRADVALTLKEARTTLEAIRRPLEEVDAGQVAGTVRAARSAVEKLDRRLSDRELGKAIADMVAALNDLTQLLQAADLTVRAGREDFIAALADLRQAAQDVRQFSRTIAQDPSAVIRGKD